jgi:exonuclease SbcC
MRITRLGFAGFGPYRDEQAIDFRAFEDDGIYLIGGRTGAGKSTILDAVCFALYASVPRFERGGEAELRSHHCRPDDPTWVELDFTAGGVEYRLHRIPQYERPKAKGDGTTKQSHKAVLTRRDADGWAPLASGAKEVASEVQRIVQLTRDQFLQVILLAQNRFQRFLAAGHDERQDVLRSLFATERFSSFEDYLVERRKDVESELGAEVAAVERLAERARSLLASLPAPPAADAPGGDAGVASSGEESTDGDVEADGDAEADGGRPDEAWFAAAAERAVPVHRAAEDAVAAAGAALAAAEAADRRAEELAARVRRRDAAAAVRDRLEARSSADAAARDEVEAARAAASLWPLVTAVDAAAARESSARSARDEAGAALADLDPDAMSDPSAAVDALTRDLGALADAVADERSLPLLDDDVQRSATRLAGARRAAEAVAERRDALPGELEAARAAVMSAAAVAGELDDATRTVEGLKRQLTAAHDARTLASDLETAQAREIAAVTASRVAASRFEHVLTARLSGFAGELAEGLVDGEPCSVCGATSHPAPAVSPSERVRDDDVEAARTELDERSAVTERASRAVREAEAAYSQALVASGGTSAEELDARLTAAEVRRDACGSASARLPQLESVVAALVEESDRADTELADRAADRDAAAEAHVAAETRRASVIARVEAARAGSSSVAERVDRITERRDAAATLVDAEAALSDRVSDAAEARAALEAALARPSGEGPRFADVDDVRSRHRDDAEVRALAARVAAAADERAANAALLADPDLSGLPDELPDTSATAAALVDARAARDAALATALGTRRIADDLASVRLDALTALSAVNARRDEVEAIRGLADAVEGKSPNTRRMDLETFVLAAQLEQIIVAANRRFSVMTSGRFALEHDDAVAYRNTASGLGLSIRDEYTGRSRPTASLSGGETFLAALALALGLAEVVTERAGGITLDTLFIDEGFGSLDAETLEIAMSTLDALRAGGRTVGLISHVDAMKERISARLTVEVDQTGVSRVRQQIIAAPV